MRIPCIAMSKANKFINFLHLTGNGHASTRYDQDMRYCFDAVASGNFTFARQESIVKQAKEGLEQLHSRVLA
jgi:hypothetical protein